MAKQYSSLAPVLKKLLFDRDMTATDLARDVGVPQPTIHRMISGKCKRPHQTTLATIAAYFDLSVEQLIGEKPLDPWTGHGDNLPSQAALRTVPIIRWQDVGNLALALSRKLGQVATFGHLGADSFALYMNDSSMSPIFPKNTTLIFDPEKQAIDRGYVLVRLGVSEVPIFRQIIFDVEHRFLKPLNPDLMATQMRLFEENDTIVASLVEARQVYETA